MKIVTRFFLLLFFLSLSAHAQDFVNPLPIPYLVQEDDIHLVITEAQHDFNPNGTDSLAGAPIATYTYNILDSLGTENEMTILGPTLAWSYKHDLTIAVENRLPNPATTHWHGAHVPVWADGGPHQRIPVGSTWNIDFPVLDKSATMWYHPHVMDDTYEQVQMGMSGMLYVEDPVDGDTRDDELLRELHDLLPHEYGVNDIPVVMQTKLFVRDTVTNNLVIDTAFGNDDFKDKYRYIINGIVDPYVNVPAQMVRLRFLGGDARFTFNLTIVDNDLNEIPFNLIATDAGYMDSSYTLNNVYLAPGERMEWLIDFSGYDDGTEFYLYNKGTGIRSGIIGADGFKGVSAPDTKLMKIVVDNSIEAPVSTIEQFPIALHPLETPAYDDQTYVRKKTFVKSAFAETDNQKVYNIDSTLMDMMVVNDVVGLGTTEIWSLNNTTDVAHPWHIHLTHFFVTEIYDHNGDSIVNPTLHPHIFKGPLDNVLIEPGWELSYVIAFETYGTEIAADSTYMYHCHILPHEDRGMMGQFVVWNGEGPGPTSVEPVRNTIDLQVYSNFAENMLYLQGSHDKATTLSIYDLNGNLLQQQQLLAFNGTMPISLQSIANPYVFVVVTDGESIFNAKVMLR